MQIDSANVMETLVSLSRFVVGVGVAVVLAGCATTFSYPEGVSRAWPNPQTCRIEFQRDLMTGNSVLLESVDGHKGELGSPLGYRPLITTPGRHTLEVSASRHGLSVVKVFKAEEKLQIETVAGRAYEVVFDTKKLAFLFREKEAGK